MNSQDTRASCPHFRARVDWRGRCYIQCGGRTWRFESGGERESQYRTRCCGDWARCEMAQKDEGEMTMLAEKKQDQALRLADYEARIHLYREQIGTGYIGIGRTLIEAKESGTVPHGEWESWVERVTGLSHRNAQRCMQAAREIKDGSALAQLEMSKALLLLGSSLDEDSREDLARKAAEEGATVKQLRSEIEKQQAQLASQATSLDTLQLRLRHESERHQEAIDNAVSLKQQTEALEKALYDASTENDDLRGQLESVNVILEREKAKAAQAAREACEAQQREAISELQEELDAAEKREARRAAELDQLRKAHLDEAMNGARGVSDSGLGVLDVAAAVRAFIGAVGALPQMADSLGRLSDADRQTLNGYIDTVKRWVLDSQGAMVRSEAISGSGTVR